MGWQSICRSDIVHGFIKQGKQMKKLIMISLILSMGIKGGELIEVKGLEISPQIVGGFNLSTVAGDATDDLDDVLFKSGISFGIENPLPWFGLFGGITYTQRGWGEKTHYTDPFFGRSEDEYKGNLNYLTLYLTRPIDVAKYIPILTEIPFLLLVGAETGIFLNGKIDWESKWDGESMSGTEDIDRDDWSDEEGNLMDFGLLFGGQYNVTPMIGIRGTYYFGLIQTHGDYEAKYRTFQISIVFTPFGLNN
jgi:hypothetical protein